MTIQTTITSERVDTHGIVGTRLCRTVEGTGFRNTLGEDETYRVFYDGTYSDGSLRARVQVQRKNGGWSMLCPNRHSQRVHMVLSCFKQRGATADYLEANAKVEDKSKKD